MSTMISGKEAGLSNCQLLIKLATATANDKVAISCLSEDQISQEQPHLRPLLSCLQVATLPIPETIDFQQAFQNHQLQASRDTAGNRLVLLRTAFIIAKIAFRAQFSTESDSSGSECVSRFLQSITARLTALQADGSSSSARTQTQQADEESLLRGLIVQRVMPTMSHAAQHPQISQHAAKVACSLLIAMTDCTPSCLQGKLTESLKNSSMVSDLHSLHLFCLYIQCQTPS